MPTLRRNKNPADERFALACDALARAGRDYRAKPTRDNRRDLELATDAYRAAAEDTGRTVAPRSGPREIGES